MADVSYEDALGLREARERYFAANGFGEHSYHERWVVLRAGPIPFAFPNTAGRVRAVRLHDLHHVLTGYGTSWAGEGEIGAWELASGCGRHWAAWALNASAAGIALWIAPRRVVEAFRRGWRRRNFYHGEWDEALLDENLGATRSNLGIPPGGEVAEGAPAPASNRTGGEERSG